MSCAPGRSRAVSPGIDSARVHSCDRVAWREGERRNRSAGAPTYRTCYAHVARWNHRRRQGPVRSSNMARTERPVSDSRCVVLASSPCLWRGRSSSSRTGPAADPDLDEGYTRKWTSLPPTSSRPTATLPSPPAPHRPGASKGPGRASGDGSKGDRHPRVAIRIAAQMPQTGERQVGGAHPPSVRRCEL